MAEKEKTTTENFLSLLKTTGNDAQSNLFLVKFTGLSGWAEADSTNLSVRIEGFTPPELKQETYPVYFGTAYIDRPKAAAYVERSFSIKFRVDASYVLYKKLMKLYSKTSQPGKSWATNDLSQGGFGVEVDTYYGDFNSATDSSAVPIFKFSDCWIESVTNPGFKADNAGPATAEFKIGFVGMQDLHNGLTVVPETPPNNNPPK